MAAKRENPYLAGVTLPANLTLTDDWRAAVLGAGTVIIAIPSEFFRRSIEPIIGGIEPNTNLISAAKGIENGSLKTMTEVLTDLMPGATRLAALSGPGFAAEIASGKPAALVIASTHKSCAKAVQALIGGPSLRIYSSTDVAGVELGGAVKNVIAIAAGISDGLGLGLSARAALVTRGLAEIMRLGRPLGARMETLAGLAGLGDLVLTCTGALSRNHSMGIAIGKGEPRRQSRPGDPVAEGIASARSVKMLAHKHKIEMPIVSAVYRCLYEDQKPKAMVEELLSREPKPEF
jgi:glycerol-3-phosphate dehydrogenase (NAD(P)+)